MGKTIVHQGGPGAGQHTKMVNQTLIASGMIGVCEGLLYAYKAGLDLNTVLQSVGPGAAGSWSLANYGPRIIANNFDPGFFVEHFIKDMGIALDEVEADGPRAAGPGPRAPALHFAPQHKATAATARNRCSWPWPNWPTSIGKAGRVKSVGGSSGQKGVHFTSSERRPTRRRRRDVPIPSR